MLVIRREQFNTLGRVPRLSYEDMLAKHFRRFYPKECARAGQEQVRKLVLYGIERAMGHGYESQRDVALYINLMLILGCDFDRDPQFPWANEQLNDMSIADPFARIQRVFQTAREYLGKTSGAGNERGIRALVRIRQYDLATAPQSSGRQLESDLIDVLEHFYPEKYDYHGRDEVLALVRHTADAAWDYGLREPPSRIVYATLAFMLGAGINRDPMYPWVGRILTDPTLDTERARVEQLHQESVAYINFMLAEQ